MAQLLVVDDDIEVAACLRLVLEDHHAVTLAANGEEGLRLLNERRPDLILLDVEMPVLNGPDMAYRIFIEDAGREMIPIVLISGVADLELVAARVGTPYYLLKPVDIEPLLETVQRALLERRAPRPALGLGDLHVQE
jgi:twitching motility two-component system response regulator PilH